MNWVVALLHDRKRRQHGGVLSGVLFITAFLAIIAGALMTEISTNFLLSRVLVNRVAIQATVDSAVERAVDELQNAPREFNCPAVTLGLNNQTALVEYPSCSPGVAPLPKAAGRFEVDGTTFSPRSRTFAYVVGDSSGTIYEYLFDSSTPYGRRKSMPPLGGAVTGAALAMTDRDGNHVLLVPVRAPTAGADPSCGLRQRCVALLDDNPDSGTATLQCYMPAAADVATRPAASREIPGVVFFGDQTGNLFAYDSTDGCNPIDAVPSVFGRVVGGPVVVRNGSRDEIYLLRAGVGSSQLAHFNWRNGKLRLAGPPLFLPGRIAVGMALEKSEGAPTRLAVSFSNGRVDLIQIDGGFNPAVRYSTWLGPGIGITAAPYWCLCPTGRNLIGVGGQDGALHVFDADGSLSPAGYFRTEEGLSIDASPTADAAGDWFFSSSRNGLLYEVLPDWTLGARFGYQTSGVQSSPLFGACPVGSCIYFAKLDGAAYLVPLVDRDVTLTACISVGPPDYKCSGANPRLWAHVKVGSATNLNLGTGPQTVRVTGWSYYSP